MAAGEETGDDLRGDRAHAHDLDADVKVGAFTDPLSAPEAQIRTAAQPEANEAQSDPFMDIIEEPFDEWNGQGGLKFKD